MEDKMSPLMHDILDHPGNAEIVHQVAQTNGIGTVQSSQGPMLVFTRKSGRDLRFTEEAKSAHRRRHPWWAWWR